MTRALTYRIARLAIAVIAAVSALASEDGKRHPAPQWTPNASVSWDSGAYSYDGAGNITTIGSDAYRYDGAGRLVYGTANTPDHDDNIQTFEYDPYGNLLSITTPNAADGAHVQTLMVEPTTNQLTKPCTAGIAHCISGVYDQAGNVTGWYQGDDRYHWDPLGMMTEIRTIDRSEKYVYDANNERIAIVSVPAATVRYTLRGSDNKVARELIQNTATSPSTWSWSKDYVYRDGLLLAEFISSESGPGPHRHFHVDHLGTPRLLTDGRGFKIAEQTYWPFGKEALGSDHDPERMKFTGHERDSHPNAPADDLDYMHARFYNPMGGRFLSVDPVLDISAAMTSPQIWNRYSYVANNPVNAVDPTGRILVKLGQHTADEIKKRQAEIKQKLKSRDISSAQRAALKREKSALSVEAQGNMVVGKMIAALEKTGQGNGLTLSNFTLSTDTRADFPSAPPDTMTKMLTKAAFVVHGSTALEGTIYVRTEPAYGFYQLSRSSQDLVYLGASALRHEQLHLLGTHSEFRAYTLQRGVLQRFERMFRDRALYQQLDDGLEKEIKNNPQ